MKRIVVTGANGFIGQPLCAHLAGRGWSVAAAVRSEPRRGELADCTVHTIPDIGAAERLIPVLRGASAVVHLAARVHIMDEQSARALEAYRRVNTQGTIDLARHAAECGVRCFAFLSTIKVNGERTTTAPFTEADAPAPADPYALSKWEAEQGLAQIAATTGMCVITLRPPLVYGPRVKGNFLRLMKLVRHRVPLPLASVTNRRSLLYVGNLVNAIETLLAAAPPKLATLLLSDDYDLSTPQLFRLIGAAMGIRPILFPCAPTLLRGLGRLAGRSSEVDRLTESLAINCTGIKQRLRWRPPFSVEEGIADSVESFLRNRC